MHCRSCWRAGTLVMGNSALATMTSTSIELMKKLNSDAGSIGSGVGSVSEDSTAGMLLAT